MASNITTEVTIKGDAAEIIEMLRAHPKFAINQVRVNVLAKVYDNRGNHTEQYQLRGLSPFMGAEDSRENYTQRAKQDICRLAHQSRIDRDTEDDLKHVVEELGRML